jgi:hypothetical protein
VQRMNFEVERESVSEPALTTLTSPGLRVGSHFSNSSAHAHLRHAMSILRRVSRTHDRCVHPRCTSPWDQGLENNLGVEGRGDDFWHHLIEAGISTSTGQSSVYMAAMAIACRVLPSPMSSPIMHLLDVMEIV